MNLYLLTQTQNNNWDTYDSCIVAADSVAEARLIHPGGWVWPNGDFWVRHPKDVTVKLIGVAAPNIEMGVICASFNAG